MVLQATGSARSRPSALGGVAWSRGRPLLPLLPPLHPRSLLAAPASLPGSNFLGRGLSWCRGRPHLPLLPPAPVHLLGANLGGSLGSVGGPCPFLPASLPHLLLSTRWALTPQGGPRPTPECLQREGCRQSCIQGRRDAHTDFHPGRSQTCWVPARLPHVCPPPAVRSRPKQLQESRPQQGLSGTLQGSQPSPAVCPGSSSQASLSSFRSAWLSGQLPAPLRHPESAPQGTRRLAH